jgi:predicted NUDIX family NTP pyrophosphohydrolase
LTRAFRSRSDAAERIQIFRVLTNPDAIEFIMASRSAGILLYRLSDDTPMVLLVHPGGPFWAKKDAGAWTIPKGLIESGEDPKEAALREFAEETGFAPVGGLLSLGEIIQAAGKRVTVFASEGDFDIAGLKSNLFELEWPPKSGRRRAFPEIDRAEWFSLVAAREKILASQAAILERLAAMLAAKAG